MSTSRRHVWTEDETVFLFLSYANNTAQQIADTLGLKLHQVYGKANDLGLTKSDEFNRSLMSGRIQQGNQRRGKDTRFKAGHTPWIKGKKLPGHGNDATKFKPGHRPSRYMPVGSVRQVQDGYWQVKLLPTGPHTLTWAFVHHLVWELHHGPIPDGYLLRFRDGNKDNIAPDNLALVSMHDSLRGNSVHALPPELKELSYLRGRITKAINNKEKQHEQGHSGTA